MVIVNSATDYLLRTELYRKFPSKNITIYKEDALTGGPVIVCEYEIMQLDGKGAWRGAIATTSGKSMAKWDNETVQLAKARASK